jgi:2',3'-cyclic-nucleotide 2'-phosphodiesterase (5'-nucleotidase family)
MVKRNSLPAGSARRTWVAAAFPARKLYAVAFLFLSLFLAVPLIYLYQNSNAQILLGARGPERVSRHLTFITVNDTYRIDGVSNDTLGGLHRLRTLRKWIERDEPNAILLHAGDFLAPSLASRVFKGEHMVDAMNHMDGDGKNFDNRMFVVFGNHEFDDSRCNTEDAPLNARVAQAQFRWLATNLDFPNCPSMKSLLSQRNVRKEGAVLEVNGVKLGLFGIGLTPPRMENVKPASSAEYPDYINEHEAAKESIKYLRERGAEFIVALTHLPKEDDEALIREFNPHGIGLLVGGHDHTNMVLPDAATLPGAKPAGFKADSDAQTAWRIDVDLSHPGKPVIKPQLITLNDAIPPDPDILELAKSWTTRAETEICRRRAEKKGIPFDRDCLTKPIGRTQSPIEIDENANRSQETAIGDWFADEVQRKTGADVVILNSGTFGATGKIEAGILNLRELITMLRYDEDFVAVRSFPASQVCEALRRGFGSPGRGAWPHTAGVEIEIEGAPGKVSPVRISGFVKRPGLSCDVNEKIKVAALPFVMCGKDGYPFWPEDLTRQENCSKKLNEKPFLDNSEKYLLGDVAEMALENAREAGIQPANRGRIRFNAAAAPRN